MSGNKNISMQPCMNFIVQSCTRIRTCILLCVQVDNTFDNSSIETDFVLTVLHKQLLYLATCTF